MQRKHLVKQLKIEDGNIEKVDYLVNHEIEKLNSKYGLDTTFTRKYVDLDDIKIEKFIKERVYGFEPGVDDDGNKIIIPTVKTVNEYYVFIMYSIIEELKSEV